MIKARVDQQIAITDNKVDSSCGNTNIFKLNKSVKILIFGIQWIHWFLIEISEGINNFITAYYLINRHVRKTIY